MKLGILQEKKAPGLLLKQHWRQSFVSQGHFLCILQAWQKLLLLLFNEEHFQQMSFPSPFPSTGGWERTTFCIMNDSQSLYQMPVKIIPPKLCGPLRWKHKGTEEQNFSIWDLPPARVTHTNPSSLGAPLIRSPTGKSSQNLVDMVIIKNSLAQKSSWGRNGQLSR